MIGCFGEIKKSCEVLAQKDILVSLFIDPERSQIDAAVKAGASVIELHTGAYAEAHDFKSIQKELARLTEAAHYAAGLGLVVNAGHGLHYHNVQAIVDIGCLHELNIGHAIVARAMFVGMHAAVREMKALM